MEGCGVVQLQLVEWWKLSGSVRPAIVEGAGRRNRDAFGAISRGLKAIGCEERLQGREGERTATEGGAGS